MKKIIIIVCLFPFFTFAQYQGKDVQLYVEEYGGYAVKLMQEDLIPASIRLAQAIYATEAGTNKLCKDANNHFAILCLEDHQGNSFTVKKGNERICYQSYTYPAVSFADHTLYLRRNKSFAPLFALPITDYKAWAKGLQQGKYCADDTYANSLINIIENYGLAHFDELGVKKMEEEAAKRADKAENIYFESGVEVVVQKEQKIKMGKTPVSQECRKDSVIIEEEKTNPALAIFTAKEFEYQPAYYPQAKRNVYENNKIKFVLAKKGDTYEDISRELKLPESAIREYNDVYDQTTQPIEGEVIYIQAKNKKSPIAYHTIKMGESPRYIAQKYAVPLEILYQRNNYSAEEFSVNNIICIACKK